MKKYDPKKIEKKWRKYWLREGVYSAKETAEKSKSYVLDMFPYPSGEGLHVGHVKGYIATDVYSRFKVMQGNNVLHPMGWDAFGLPAENYAIKNKIHPKISTDKNIKRFKKQLEQIGFNYDWEREINTTDPEYYKWTQWIFLQMYKKGLAYESYEPINWCPSCKTGLANEDLDGDKCERCETKIERKPMRQWVLKITDYAERLLEDLDSLNWPKHIKELQKNWIGKSEGAEISFKVENQKSKVNDIEVFTTRPDTVFGVTYLVISPEHVAISSLKSQISNPKEVEEYMEKAKNKTDIERTAEGKDKTGVELKGIMAVNPANGESVPVWVADYVLGGYGTGAIMAVPAHDERDFEFSKKYKLPIKQVICQNYPEKKCPVLDNAYVGRGCLVGSGKFDGMENEKAKKEIIKFVGGKTKTTYKLKDWVFSRQRYWGEPIPLVHCSGCGVVPVPEEDLPVELPKVKSYEPTGTGESPLAAMDKWVNTKCPKCGGAAKRETNTMPQWAGSSWYYLRYIDPKNDKKLVDGDKEKYWMPVDVYVGGAEHATRHLIYARFWHKFLYDIGAVSGKEPFSRLYNVGLVMAEDGRKMSKRWGNVVNPDDVAEKWGADTLRMYEMFMGPFDQSIPWSENNLIGLRRFLDRIWGLRARIKNLARLASESVAGKQESRINNPKLESLVHKTIKKITGDIEEFKFNTAVSSLMILLNEMEKEESLEIESYELIIKLLTPFAPHITEEIWQEILGNKTSIHLEKWPECDESKLKEDFVKIIIQVNGKTRDVIEVPVDSGEEEVRVLTLKRENVKKWIAGKAIKRFIFIKNKLVNIVPEK